MRWRWIHPDLARRSRLEVEMLEKDFAFRVTIINLVLRKRGRGKSFRGKQVCTWETQ